MACPLLARRHEVGVDPEREAGVGMPEVRREGLDALPCVEKRGGVEVAQRVHPGRPGGDDAGRFHRWTPALAVEGGVDPRRGVLLPHRGSVSGVPLNVDRGPPHLVIRRRRHGAQDVPGDGPQDGEVRVRSQRALRLDAVDVLGRHLRPLGMARRLPTRPQKRRHRPTNCLRPEGRGANQRTEIRSSRSRRK